MEVNIFCMEVIWEWMYLYGTNMGMGRNFLILKPLKIPYLWCPYIYFFVSILYEGEITLSTRTAFKSWTYIEYVIVRFACSTASDHLECFE